MFLEPAAEGFPRELFPHLVDFWKRGFGASVAEQESVSYVDLSPFARPLSGRPVDTEVHERGKKAAALHRQGRTYGKIALELCPERTDSHHRCGGKKCADRLRQAAKPYLKEREVR